MVDLLFPISEFAKEESKNPEVEKVNYEATYKLFGIQQFNSTSLWFGIGRIKTINNQSPQIKPIFCWIQPDYKLKEKQLSIDKLPKLYDYRVIIENEEKINRMFWLSDAIHSGNITKMLDLKTRDNDYLASVDDKKTMIHIIIFVESQIIILIILKKLIPYRDKCKWAIKGYMSFQLWFLVDQLYFQSNILCLSLINLELHKE